MKSNAVIVITGASSGIGLECARVFFHAGCQVVAAARNLEALTALQNELDPAANRLLIYKMDVTHEQECKQLIEAAIQKFGSIDVLINNAGITMRAWFIVPNMQCPIC